MLTEKKYDVYGIGNALLDRNIEIESALLVKLNIEKGCMHLSSQTHFQALIAAIGRNFCYSGCGGSAANTLIALSQFGGKGFYSCKVANDEAGHIFLQELLQFGLSCNLNPSQLSAGITGQCLVLITEDADRTMNTYLGISETLCEMVLDRPAIAASKYLYLEGYLLASSSAKIALQEAVHLARQTDTKIALTLSDPNMVRYFKEDFLTLMGRGVDLIFCNEDEALLFANTNHIETAVSTLGSLAHTLIITRGPKGAILKAQDKTEIHPTISRQPLDSCGAGDIFAGAYLFGITQELDSGQSIRLANEAAAEVVSQYGPRLPLKTIHAMSRRLQEII